MPPLALQKGFEIPPRIIVVNEWRERVGMWVCESWKLCHTCLCNSQNWQVYCCHWVERGRSSYAGGRCSLFWTLWEQQAPRNLVSQACICETVLGITEERTCHPTEDSRTSHLMTCLAGLKGVVRVEGSLSCP
jgi:hypothetical protein